MLVHEHGGRVFRYLTRIPGLRRIRQVVPEADVDPVAGRARADHDKAAGRVEANQVGHGRKDLGRGADPDRRLARAIRLIRRDERGLRSGGR